MLPRQRHHTPILVLTVFKNFQLSMIVFHMKRLYFACLLNLYIHGVTDIAACSFYFFQDIITFRNPFKVFWFSIRNPLSRQNYRSIIFRIFHRPRCRGIFCFLQVIAVRISFCISRIVPPGLIKNQMSSRYLTVAVGSLRLCRL